MKIVVFGLSITSSWGNGHATTFRALLKALHERGHHIVFYEKDLEWYASNRDLPVPGFCEVRLFDDWADVLPGARAELRNADVAMVGSYFPHGVAAIGEILDCPSAVKAFYDIDTPITMTQLREQGRTDYLQAEQVPELDVYFSFTGGPALRELEAVFGARMAVPLYCSFDPETYHPRRPGRRFGADLSYMGTYAADRQPKIEQMLCEPARRLAEGKFLVAGPQYPKDLKWPANVRRIMHLNPRWHPTFYSSSRLTLNVTRRDMVMAGYSPSVRLFEAAACGATIISDNWPGLDTFFRIGEEILLPAGADDVVRYLTAYDDAELRAIGRRACDRVLAEHTSAHRAREFEDAVEKAAARHSAGTAVAS